MASFNRITVALVLAMVALLSLPARAQVEIDITRGNVDPTPVAIPYFQADIEGATLVGSLSQIGTNIADVIEGNLERSGLFSSISRDAFISEPISTEIRPRFGNWRAIGAQALVTGRIELQADGQIRVEFRLWDVFAESQMTGLRLSAPAQNWRRVAHMVSDAIYRRLTGEEGYFDTRIVYISETGPRVGRIKRLAIMDQDGANHRYLTDGADLVLTPRFSPSRQEITYMAFYNNRPRVYLFNIETGRHEVLGDFPNMTFAPRFSPDGNKVIMSLAENGNSDVYEMDLRTRAVRRLTNHPGIDTSPSYSPDGERMVFNSDRGGSQQLYVMNPDGSGIKRISFGNGRYGTPAWSPRGDLIAFTKIAQGKFRIGVMYIDGSGERLLTDAWQDEGPTWSPNGRVMMFFRTGRPDRNGIIGPTELWSVDLTGFNERRVDTPVDGSDPAWSPLLR